MLRNVPAYYSEATRRMSMNKTFEMIKKVFTIVVAVIAVLVMIFTIVSVTTFNRNDRKIFGFKIFIVLSDSMKATDFAAGDIVVVKSTDPMKLKEGDIISFSSQDPDKLNETVTHKIFGKTVDANGDYGFITYGTSNRTDDTTALGYPYDLDKTVVTFPYIYGKYIFHLPKLGLFFNFLKTTPGYIICILIPFLLLIGVQGLNSVKLFRRYRKEQMASMEEERAKLAEERQKSEEMMAELLKLKAQMAAGTAAAPDVPAVPDAPTPAAAPVPAPAAETPVKAEPEPEAPQESAASDNPEE